MKLKAPVSLLGAGEGALDALSPPQRQVTLAALWRGAGESMEELLARAEAWQAPGGRQ